MTKDPRNLCVNLEMLLLTLLEYRIIHCVVLQKQNRKPLKFKGLYYNKTSSRKRFRLMKINI